MSNAVEQFRAAVIEGLNRLRAIAGTNPEHEYDRAVAFVQALPVPAQVQMDAKRSHYDASAMLRELHAHAAGKGTT